MTITSCKGCASMQQIQKTEIKWTEWLLCEIEDYKCNLSPEMKRYVRPFCSCENGQITTYPIGANMTFPPISCSVWLSRLITLTKAEARHYLSTLTPTLRLLPRQNPAVGTKPELGWNASVAVKLHGGAFLIGCSASWLGLFRAGRKALRGFINGALVAEPETYSMGLLVQLVRITREWFIITSSGT